MSEKLKTKKVIFWSITGLFLIVLLWGIFTNNIYVWPVRNLIQYKLMTMWWGAFGEPQKGGPAVLKGRVVDEQNNPIEGAWVLVSRFNGESYSAESDKDGNYLIKNIPGGRYRPVAGKHGYEDAVLGEFWGRMKIAENEETTLNITLKDAREIKVQPGTDLVLGEPEVAVCGIPIPTRASKREIFFNSAGKQNQRMFFYTPEMKSTTEKLPVFVAINPGFAIEWECSSVPIAASGFAVISTGPDYSLDLENDIDEIERVIMFVREGQIPDVDPDRIALAGGSYSALLVLRLLERDNDFDAAGLLGAPTDLFEMRKFLEEGKYVPPFDLDKVLRALGFPDRNPAFFWRYSSIYHLDKNLPPFAILHSYNDELVPYQQSEYLVRELNKLNIPNDTFFFYGASHYLLSEKGGAQDILRFTVEFLKKHLK